MKDFDPPDDDSDALEYWLVPNSILTLFSSSMSCCVFYMRSRITRFCEIVIVNPLKLQLGLSSLIYLFSNHTNLMRGFFLGVWYLRLNSPPVVANPIEAYAASACPMESNASQCSPTSFQEYSTVPSCLAFFPTSFSLQTYIAHLE